MRFGEYEISIGMFEDSKRNVSLSILFISRKEKIILYIPVLVVLLLAAGAGFITLYFTH